MLDYGESGDTEKEAEKIMAQIDINNDGDIGFHEFE